MYAAEDCFEMEATMEHLFRIKYQSQLYELPYEVVYSRRKTCAVSISAEGKITLRLPLRTSESQIRRLLLDKQHWIITHYLEAIKRTASRPVSDLTDAQRTALEKRYIAAAKDYFPKRAAYFAPITGGNYQRITIRDQKTRWGSCSAKGTLSFNWRLMLAPPAVLDYVVVHELCHLTHMNHSKAFWALVESACPDYRAHRKWLKEHGQELIL
ncbi:MAG: M48 family metallopeptidase [Lachnospiraceae bacterium]|nr:M48 family metallopeptidase [Lachnospiraceae bacterium]